MKPVFSNNSNVVATSLTSPVFFDIKSTKFSESISREEKSVPDNYIKRIAEYLYRNNSKRNINENTIVEALALDNYVKNKKQTRYHILKNYLSNKTPANRFKNKYQIEQAIKHINDEMDEASKEFSKLFASNDKEYS